MAKPKAAKRSYKLDMMTVLEAIDLKKRGFYANLTEEEKKAFVPLITMRWLSALSDKNAFNQQYQILACNELVNVNMWSLSKHPELLYLLMTVAGLGSKQYHQWIPSKGKASTTPRIDALLEQLYPNCNEQEMQLIYREYDAEAVKKLALQSGLDDRGVREIQEELKKYPPHG
jgi:hypothetical protein